MELWGRTIEAEADVVGAFPPAVQYHLSLAVIEGTIPIFEPPFEEFFPAKVREVIEPTLRKINEAVPKFQLGQGDVAAYFAGWDSIGRIPLIPGTGPFLVAIGRLVEAMAGEIDGDETLEIMSACYEAIVMSNIVGTANIDKEYKSERCVAAIRMQQRLIEESGSL